eukprot:10895889-Alexandrium_andersonii.AAC.1
MCIRDRPSAARVAPARAGRRAGGKGARRAERRRLGALRVGGRSGSWHGLEEMDLPSGSRGR